MNWLDALTKIVGSLAWPFIALIAIINFKHEIRRLIGRIKSVKFKDAEVLCDLADAQIAQLEEAKDAAEEKLRVSEPDAKRDAILRLEDISLKLEKIRMHRRHLAKSFITPDGNLSPGRVQIMRELVGIIGKSKILSLSNRGLIKVFKNVKNDINNLKYEGLNGGALTGLMFAEIVDDDFNLTEKGAALLKNFAEESATIGTFHTG